MIGGIEISIAGAVMDTIYRSYENRLLREIRKGPIPDHIAIIMDGNRRFARSLGLCRLEGHKRGKSKLEEVLAWAQEIGVKILTVYAFSTENRYRSDDEVDELMALFERSFREAADDPRVHEEGIRIRAIGNIDILPNGVKEAIKYAEDKTKDYDRFHLIIAIAYGGREELTSAIRSIVRDARKGQIEEEEIDQELISRYLYTRDLPDPDLILRTSGEIRLSNFLLWQLAYSELYFTDIYWPEFRKVDFLRAIRSYQKRKRRFGR